MEKPPFKLQWWSREFFRVLGGFILNYVLKRGSRLINLLKIPKMTLRNRPTNFRNSRWKLHLALGLAETPTGNCRCQLMAITDTPLLNQWTVLLVMFCQRLDKWEHKIPILSFNLRPPSTGNRPTYWASIDVRRWGWLTTFGYEFGPPQGTLGWSLGSFA